MSRRPLKGVGIGRFELLEWLNRFLETDYAKLEDLKDGIAYCQILDALYPGKIPLEKVYFNAKYKPDFKRNMSIFQQSMKSCSIRKEINMEKLTNGVFHEHFELLQWLYIYVNEIYPEALILYCGYERRVEAQKKEQVGNSFVKKSFEYQGWNPNLLPRFTIRPGAARKSMSSPKKSPRSSNEIDNYNTSTEEIHFDLSQKKDEEKDDHNPSIIISLNIALKKAQEMENILSSSNDFFLNQSNLDIWNTIKDMSNRMTQDLQIRLEVLNEMSEALTQLKQSRNKLFDSLIQIESYCKSNIKSNIPSKLSQEILQIIYDVPNDFGGDYEQKIIKVVEHEEIKEL